jgi:hypothetical protein
VAVADLQLQELQVVTAAQVAAVVVVQAQAEDQQAHRVKVIMAALAQPTSQLMQTAAAEAVLVRLAVMLDQVMLVLVALEALHLLPEHQSPELVAAAEQELRQAQLAVLAAAELVIKQILQRIQELLIQEVAVVLKTVLVVLDGTVLAVQAVQELLLLDTQQHKEK